ncbi:MAG: class I SAM-dependent methyltransferase [Elusimicrobia bacterium]|nr:class I SAM-dependent methyltransferase [Elusimicrobiota bacterium]
MSAEWWRTFFRPSRFPIEALAPEDQTAAEVRALRRLLPRGSRVLDVACGAGRHSVGLARLGYDVTGADLSKPYLALARRRARRARVDVRFLRRDMRRLGLRGEFDAALNLWTSLGYFASPRQDVEALRSMREALKPGGRLLLEVIDDEWARRHVLRRNWSQVGRRWMLEATELRDGADPAFVSERWLLGPGGRAARTRTVVRRYDARRLRAALASAGFARVTVRPGLLEPGAARGRRKRLLAIAWRAS